MADKEERVKLNEQILNDYREAMKARDGVRSTLLSTLRAELANAALREKKDALDEAGIIAVIRKLIKQHQDSIEQFEKGNRQDLAEKEKRELEILKAYLPPELSDTDLQAMVDDAIKSAGAQSPKDMGNVMKELMPKVGAACDAKRVSECVRQRLAPQP